MSRRSLRNYQFAAPQFARLERMAMRHSRAVLGNSRAVVTELREEGIPEQKLGLLYSGVELGGLDTRPDQLREQEGLGENDLLLGIIANLHPYKGHLNLLKALSTIRDRLPAGWKLLCIGQDAGCQADLTQAVAQLGLQGSVLFLGPRQDAARYWAILDIGLLVSAQEGFSMALLEGMAASVPMIVTDVGGNAEALTHGVSGIVVALDDIPALADAILAYAQSPQLRRQHGTAAARRIHEVFSLEGCVSGYQRLYQALLAHHDGSVQDILDSKDA